MLAEDAAMLLSTWKITTIQTMRVRFYVVLNRSTEPLRSGQLNRGLTLGFLTQLSSLSRRNFLSVNVSLPMAHPGGLLVTRCTSPMVVTGFWPQQSSRGRPRTRIWPRRMTAAPLQQQELLAVPTHPLGNGKEWTRWLFQPRREAGEADLSDSQAG
jgi:hypothetical protein